MSESKNNQIMHTHTNWSDQLKSCLQESDHNYSFTNQEIDESKIAFIDANQLNKRWSTWQDETFCIAEIGFGYGLNFLLTCFLFEQFLFENPDHPLKKLSFSSFENNHHCKEDLSIALNKYPSLQTYITLLLEQYPLDLPGCHRIHLHNITLDLWIGDVNDTLSNLYLYETGLFDCWFVDHISLNTKPDILNNDLFVLIAKTSKLDAILATNSSEDSLKQNLQAVGYIINNQKGSLKNDQLLIGQLERKTKLEGYAQCHRPSKIGNSKDIAIIGGGISSACLSLALVNRGYDVTLYCKDNILGSGASGNQQGALYPLLNKQHNALSQLFANSFLYARNYVEKINHSHPFDYDLSGLLQLYYDESSTTKLNKILQAKLPSLLVQKLNAEQTDKLAELDIGQSSLFYPLAGWLSPTQMVNAIFDKAQQTGKLTIKLNHHLQEFIQHDSGWLCQFQDQSLTHDLLVLTTAMHTLDFTQCEAIPLSAARGQVSHIQSNPELQNLKLTLCHEGYLTPLNKGIHCMGATFKRHSMNERFSLQEQIENKDKLSKCIKDKSWVEDININHEYANVGIRCTTRDHFPYMGALPDYLKTKHIYQNADKKMPNTNAPFFENLFILTGLGSRGLNTAPLLAETLASQINHEPLPLNQAILNSMQCNRQWLNYLKKGKPLKF